MADPSGETTLRRRRTAPGTCGGTGNNNTNNRPTATQAADGNNDTHNNTNNTNNADNTNNDANNNRNQRGWFNVSRGAIGQFIFRSLLTYFMIQQVSKSKDDKPAASSPTDSSDPNMSPSPVIDGIMSPTPSATPKLSGMNEWLSNMGVVPGPQPAYYSKPVHSRWAPFTAFDVRLVVSTDKDIEFRKAVTLPSNQVIWSLSSLTYSTEERNYHSKNVTIDVPNEVSLGNSSWFAHVFVVKGKLWDVASVGAVSDSAIREHVLYTRHDLVTWIEVNLKKEGKHLLGQKKNKHGEEEIEKEDEKEQTPTESDPNSETVSDSDSEEPQCLTKNEDGVCSTTEEGEKTNVTLRFDHAWKPSVPIVIVVSQDQLTLSHLPPAAAERFTVNERASLYDPPMHVEEFWHIRDTLKLMNSTVSSIDIELSFTPISLQKWSLYRQFDNMWAKQLKLGAVGKGDVDEMKRMFIETNPVLLGTTMVVSVAHSVLEGLAFKNDISHWRNIKTMEGVSVRSMVWKIVMEMIIFLYLWDHDTSWMIVIGNGAGLVIEVWKFCKAVKFDKFGKKKLFGVIPWVSFSDHESYSKKTKEYDEQAMKYMGYLVYPLVIGYALYSLKFDTHKSWYSWIVNSLVGAVYAFGFIMMFPQIFINYKLKSVAHIPMKAMMYKTLNTIIDDLFSFIIKMPWLHRLACFRDDIVFAVLLYQRYLYPTDYTRVNEFGQQFDDKGELATGGTANSETPGEGTTDDNSNAGQEDSSSSAVSVAESSSREIVDANDEDEGEDKHDERDNANVGGDGKAEADADLKSKNEAREDDTIGKE